MSILEEIHSRHVNFHRSIARKAAKRSEPVKSFAPEPTPEPTTIDWGSIVWFLWFCQLVQEQDHPLPPTVIAIRAATAKYYGITINDMVSNRRMRNLVRPRQVAMYLSRELTPLSLPSICRHFGNRDHSTAIHACRTIERLMAADEQIAMDVKAIANKFGGMT